MIDDASQTISFDPSELSEQDESVKQPPHVVVDGASQTLSEAEHAPLFSITESAQSRGVGAAASPSGQSAKREQTEISLAGPAPSADVDGHVWPEADKPSRPPAEVEGVLFDPSATTEMTLPLPPTDGDAFDGDRSADTSAGTGLNGDGNGHDAERNGDTRPNHA